jgi:hypothetical protein
MNTQVLTPEEAAIVQTLMQKMNGQPAPSQTPPQYVPPVQPKQNGQKRPNNGGKWVKKIQAEALKYLAITGIILLVFVMLKYSDFNTSKLAPVSMIDVLTERCSQVLQRRKS